MITQRLILDGPAGVPTCVGCHGALTEGRIQHPDDCLELRRGNGGPLPTAAQVQAWLEEHGWHHDPPGPAGALWYRPGCPADVLLATAVPGGDGDTRLLGGALERIAKRAGVPFGEMLTGMRATEVGETSDA